MEIALSLDAQHKQTVADLFIASTQVPMPVSGTKPMTEDGLAIFRIAKEFSLSTSEPETKLVHAEDLGRLLRFAGWLLTYGGNTSASLSSGPVTLRQFIVTSMLQAQSQYSGFESILRALGVDRQLEPQAARPHSSARNAKAGSKVPAMAGITADRTTRTNEVKIRVDAHGAELTRTQTETNWSAGAWKTTDDSKGE